MRLGSSMSIYGLSTLGSSLSILDFVSMGSSLSIKSFCRLGSSLSVSGEGGTRLGGLEVTDTEPGVKVSLSVVGSSHTSMHISNDGGQLLGTWNADEVVTQSESRIKRNVRPLSEELRSSSAAGGRQQGNTHRPNRSPISDLLKQLEPVAYKFATDGESPVRFGFIADQVDQVLPQVIRGVKVSCARPGRPAQPGQKRCESAAGAPYQPNIGVRGIVYQDLVAVLTEAAREHESRFETLEARVSRVEEVLVRVEKVLGLVSLSAGA